MSPHPGRRILRCSRRAQPARPVDRDTDYQQMVLVHQMRICAKQAAPEKRAKAQRSYIKLRNAFVEKKLGLAYSKAREYENRGLDMDDLNQVCIEGLIKAADRWEPEHANYGFSTYALFWIRDALQNHLRFNETAVRVEYSIHRRLDAIEAAERRMPPGYLPSDLALATGLTEDQIAEAKAAPCRLYQAGRLSQPRESGEDQDVRLQPRRRPDTLNNPTQYEDDLLLRLDAKRLGYTHLSDDGEVDPPPQRRPSAKLVEAAMHRAKTKRSKARP